MIKIIYQLLRFFLRHFYNLKYACLVKSVGHNVHFGGPNIVIVGGRGEKGKGVKIGNCCTIYDCCKMVTDDFDEICGITISNNCHFNYGCYLSGTGGLYIGNNCLFGPSVKIITSAHNFSNINIDIINQGLTRKRVYINDNVWVGAGAIILPGVVIESGAIIAAGSVVTKRVFSNTIVGGIPARILKHRENECNGIT